MFLSSIGLIGLMISSRTFRDVLRQAPNRLNKAIIATKPPISDSRFSDSMRPCCGR